MNEALRTTCSSATAGSDVGDLDHAGHGFAVVVRFIFAATIAVAFWIPIGSAIWVLFTLKAAGAWFIAFTAELILDRSITRSPVDAFGYWFKGYQRLSLFVAKGTVGVSRTSILGPEYRNGWDFLADCGKVIFLSAIFWGSGVIILQEVGLIPGSLIGAISR